MIRRTVRDAAGAESWVLISQVEHARLAGVLAEQWGGNSAAPLRPRTEILEAVFHHDDGWADWERTAGIDAKSGRPLDFTEMPLVESLAIWRDSIATASSLNRLAGYAVSAHFCALLRRFSSRWQGVEAMTTIAQEFLTSQERQQAQWREDWGRHVESNSAAMVFDHAFRFLQFFDSVSLWLCCSESPKPETFEPPSGPAVSFRSTAKGQVAVSPWPFQPERLKLDAVGRAIPIARYDSPAALATAPAQPASLTWELFPA